MAGVRTLLDQLLKLIGFRRVTVRRVIAVAIKGVLSIMPSRIESPIIRLVCQVLAELLMSPNNDGSRTSSLALTTA